MLTHTSTAEYALHFDHGFTIFKDFILQDASGKLSHTTGMKHAALAHFIVLAAVQLLNRSVPAEHWIVMSASCTIHNIS